MKFVLWLVVVLALSVSTALVSGATGEFLLPTSAICVLFWGGLMLPFLKIRV
jgi:hypothetical protein